MSIIFTNSDIVSKKPAFSSSVSVLVNFCYSYLKEHRFHSTVFHLNQFRHIRCWDTQAVIAFWSVSVILFSLSYRYIDDLISFNNKRFKEFISDIYPKEVTISETTESTSIASYLELLFIRDKSNNVTTKLYDKRDAFGFHIVNFPFMSSNIPSAPAYGVYASQLIPYARCCSNYSDFLLCHRALVTRFLSQGYKANRLSNTIKKFYGRHTDLVGQYKKNICQMFADSISWNYFYF